MKHDSAGQAGAHRTGEIEITQKMVEAGVVVLRDSGRLTNEVHGPDQVLVEDILRAAFAQAHGSRTTGVLAANR
jgi:hypothetical protein